MSKCSHFLHRSLIITSAATFRHLLLLLPPQPVQTSNKVWWRCVFSNCADWLGLIWTIRPSFARYCRPKGSPRAAAGRSSRGGSRLLSATSIGRWASLSTWLCWGKNRSCRTLAILQVMRLSRLLVLALEISPGRQSSSLSARSLSSSSPLLAGSVGTSSMTLDHAEDRTCGTRRPSNVAATSTTLLWVSRVDIRGATDYVYPAWLAVDGRTRGVPS